MPFVGERVPRKDVIDKVTGRTQYVDDICFPNMLYAATVRSKVAYGKINSINVEKALKADGVIAVLTAKDIPGKNINPLVYQDQPFLAETEVKYYGEPIAIIVANTLRQAQEACKLVELDITPKKPILSIKEALDPNAPKIYGENNIFTSYTISKGNVDEAFKAAYKVYQQEYETPYQEHAYLETNGMLAVWGNSDQITVYGSMQCPFYVHDAVTNILGIPRSKVRIIQTPTGGGFGGKEDFPSIVAGHVALAAYYTKRPVKLIYTREEDIISSSKRHPAIVKIKIGVDKIGKLLAAEIYYYIDGGAYATLSPIVLWRGTVHALGPYKCDNVLVKSFAVATNKVPCGAFRGFGSPQVIFAAESMLDEISYDLGINPLEIRKINALSVGDKTITGQVISESCGLHETISKAVEAAGWKEKWHHPDHKKTSKSEIKYGIGISTIFYGVGLGAGGKHLDRAGASIIIQKDGSVSCAVGNTEMGQGAITVLSQIVADTLGIPYELVNLSEVDTAFVPDSGPTVASRTTFMSGNALISAANELKNRLLSILTQKYSCSVSDLEIKDGFAYLKSNPENTKTSYFELVKEMYNQRILPSAFGWYVAPTTSFDKDTGMGSAYYVYSWCTNIAEVEVNTTTGEVKVLKITSAHDVGKAINPQLVEGQIEGGVVQGLGYALMEEIKHDENGKLLNDSFATYIIPTFEDIPQIQPIIVEHPYSQGPFGAKGFGEVPLMGIAPAIANAVYNAIGVRIRKLPIKPEAILEKLELGNK